MLPRLFTVGYNGLTPGFPLPQLIERRCNFFLRPLGKLNHLRDYDSQRFCVYLSRSRNEAEIHQVSGESVHCVYDQNSISHSGCLVREFFFDMTGWHGDGVNNPAKRE